MEDEADLHRQPFVNKYTHTELSYPIQIKEHVIHIHGMKKNVIRTFLHRKMIFYWIPVRFIFEACYIAFHSSSAYVLECNAKNKLKT
jgi:hypothetical protein